MKADTARTLDDQAIRAAVEAVLPGILDFRHEMHAHPELAFEEHGTAARIAAILQAHGIAHRCGVGGTGIVADLGDGSGAAPVRTLAIRSDIDALPIPEATNLPFASRYPGKSHACGHDVHAAVLLGAALVIEQLGGISHGRVRLIFQPAEETLGGAQAMIADGVLADMPDAILGYHVSPELPPGTIGFCRDTAMASKDDFRLEIIGSCAHEAHPHLAKDCVQAAAELTVQINGLAARLVAPTSPVVLRVTSITAAPVQNSIPERAILTGTLRSTDESARRRCIEGVTAALTALETLRGVTTQLAWTEGAPVLVNDRALLGTVRRAAEHMLGREHIADMPGPSMGSEDFAFLARAVRHAAHFRIGVCGGPHFAPLHAPSFLARDEAIAPAIAVLVSAASAILAQ